MIPRIYAFLLLTFCSLPTLVAQLTPDDRAIIYYEDGSIFIGPIIAEDANFLTLVAITNDTIHINKGFIKKAFRTDKNILLHPGGKMHYTLGQFVSTSMGWGLSDNPSFDWDIILGRRLDKKWSVGLGASLSFNSVWNFRGISMDNHFVPVFAYGRYYLTHNKARLFAFSRLGYGFRSSWFQFGDHTGGLHFQPGIGVHFASRKRVRFIITLSQMLQHTKGNRVDFDFLSNPINIDYNFFYNRTMLKVGMEFR